MIAPAFWEGLGAGLALSVAAAIVARWLLERWARREPSLLKTHAAVTAPTVQGSAVPPESSPTIRPAPAAGEPAVGAGPASAPRPAPALGPADGLVSVPANGGQVRISQRVLFHIAAQGRIGPDEVAPRALCQAGIGEALAVSQGALTGVLRRLVAAGILEEKRQHARGTDRRVKVYRLTPSGQQLYRELRGTRGPSVEGDLRPRSGRAAGRSPAPRASVAK